MAPRVLYDRYMLSQADLQIALAFALREFGTPWKIVSDCSPVDPLDPNHWASGAHSFQVTLRHRVTGQLKALGRRIPDDAAASPHRGLALSLVEAYGQGNSDPLRRYLEEVGVVAGTTRDTTQFFRRAEGAGSADASSAEPVAALAAGVGGDVTMDGAASGPDDSTSDRRIGATPKWRPPSTVTSRPRSEPPRPVLRTASVGPRARAATVSRGRMLSKLKRELEIWQWRRAVNSGKDKNADTRHE